jgi:hypothetical protein
VLSGLARKIAPDTFEYVGQKKTYHSLVEWAKDYVPADLKPAPKSHYLPGSWIFEFGGRRARQLEETPESIGVRVCEMVAQ